MLSVMLIPLDRKCTGAILEAPGKMTQSGLVPECFPLSNQIRTILKDQLCCDAMLMLSMCCP